MLKGLSTFSDVYPIKNRISLLRKTEMTLMKRLSGFLILAIIIITIGAFIFFNKLQIVPHSLLKHLPASKSHKHATSDADVIEHTHTYDLTSDTPAFAKPTTSEKTSVKKHPIQLDWERIDLETVRKKYQPYSIAEMHKIWAQDYSNQISSDKKAKLDKVYPPTAWLKRNLALGQPIVNYSDYQVVLQRRMYMVNRKDLWRAVGPEDRAKMRKNLQLPPEVDTWKEYEEAFLKFWIVASYESLLAEETETVYVHVTEGGRFSKFTGARLKRKEKYDLMYYGVVPEGIHVVYLNEQGEHLSPGTKPRLYEWYMKELERAYTNVEKMVVDHKAFFVSQSLKNAKQSKLSTQEQIQESFALLRDLHWDELPKDLKALQDVINRLKKIKQEGEEKMGMPHLQKSRK